MSAIPITVERIKEDSRSYPVLPAYPGVSISIIAPVHNEAQVLPELYRRVAGVMDCLGEPWELILVNDGSQDQSAEIIGQLHADDSRVKGISLSRNFGFQVAVTAGLDAAHGDAIILIDAD